MEQGMSIDSIREALATAATLGTARRAFELPRATGALGAALARIDPGSDSEHALLNVAAVVTSFGRAGFRALRAPEGASASPADQDTRSVCSPVATQHLLTLLNSKERGLLPEWLALLASNGKRVPAHLLPDLLEAGRQAVELRPQVRAAIGARGQWLAAQNLDWQYARSIPATSNITLEQVADAWQTGTRAARLTLLEATRPVAPDVARTLIEMTWVSEKADERAAFLETFADGLTMADEPFLETVLDDRSRPVRKTAADLLARLPDSRLVQRMTVRVTPLLRWTAPGGARLFGLMRGKSGSIELALPETCDKATLRDGVDAKLGAETYSVSDQVKLLAQLLRAIPPSYWVAHWQSTPEKILAAARAHPEHSDILISAWADATRLNRDAAWADALLRLDPEWSKLLLILPIERQEALLLDWLKRSTTTKQQAAVFTLLRAARHQWSAALSRVAWDALLQVLKRQSDQSYYTLVQTMNEAAYRLSSALVSDVATAHLEPKQIHDNWRNASERMLNTLRFRYDMEQALRT